MHRAPKSPEQKLAELQAKRDRITAQMDREKAKLKSIERKRDTRRKIVAGAIVLTHAELDPEFDAQLSRLLAKHVTRPEDRELFSLDPLPNKSEASSDPSAFNLAQRASSG